MARGSIKVGTAGQLADHGTGYSANGESQFSRQSASAPVIKLSEGKRTHGRLIRENQKGLVRLQRRAYEERDPVALAKIKKDIAIKTAFIAKLQSEQ
jgi:hypothetical protein